MAIIRRMNGLPFGNALTTNARKRKLCELPIVEITSASSSSDEESDSDDRSVIVVSPTVGRVHFAQDLDEDDFEDDDECPPPPADLDYLEENKAELWWPKSTRQKFQKEALETIQSFKSEHPNQVSTFGALYRAKSANVESAADNQDPSASTLELPLSMRGLEWGITPTLKKKRQHHIRQVLLACDIPDEARRERVVASRARKSSRIACQVAHQLAAGKGIVFADADGEECIVSSDCDEALPASNDSSITGLPPREPLQAKRMRLWQR